MADKIDTKDKEKSRKGLHLPSLRKKKKDKSIEGVAPTLHELIDLIGKREGFKVEGILRLSGPLPTINALHKQVLKGKSPDFKDVEDINTLTGLLKLLLRELPEPLLTFANYDPLVDRKTMISKELPVRIKLYQALIGSLPVVHKDILDDLMSLVHKIMQHESETRMNAKNLAVVLGPTILRSKSEALESMLLDSSKIVEAVQELIELYPQLGAIKFADITLSPIPVEPVLSPRGPSDDPAFRKLQRRVDELETKMAAETLEKEVLTTYKSQLEAKLKAKEDELAVLVEEKEETEADNNKAQDELKKLRDQLKTAEDALITDSKKSQIDKDALSKQVAELTKQTKTDAEEIKRLKADLQSAQAGATSKTRIEADLKNETAEKIRLQKQLEEAKAKREQEINKLQEEFKKKEAELKQKHEAENKAKHEAEDKARQVSTKLTQSIDALAAKEKALQKQLEETSQVKLEFKKKEAELQAKIQSLTTAAAATSTTVNPEMKAVLDHLFNYMSLAIKLDMHAQHKNINFDKFAIEKVIQDKKIHYADWPQLIYQAIETATVEEEAAEAKRQQEAKDAAAAAATANGGKSKERGK